MSLENLITSMRIELLACDYHKLDSWWNFKRVHSPFSRLYYISEGEAYVTHHNKTFHLLPGTVHLIPCFTFCDLHCPSNFAHYHISFTSRLPGGVDILSLLECEYSYQGNQDLESKFMRILELNRDRRLKELDPYKQLREEIKLSRDMNIEANKSPGDIIETGGIIRIILAKFLHKIDKITKSRERDWLEPILTYIEKNLDKHIDLQSLSKEVALHPTYFSDMFTKKTGVRPIKYIIKKRMDRAHTLLLSTDKSIKEVADACGFENVTYFSREFKKYFHLPPGKYRTKF